MIPMTLQQIADATNGTLAGVADPLKLVDKPLSFDNRNPIRPGSLFACLRGEHTDGHNFAQQAVDSGAVAVLASEPVTVPAVMVPDVTRALGDLAKAVAARFTGTTLALTGSAGKTSTKDLLLQILQLDGPTVANVASFNNEIGFPATVLRVEEDTSYLVLEMGARGSGHITYLMDIARPQISAVLNVGTAHLGEFGTREAIAHAKAEIVRDLPETAIAVLNGDDPLVRAMADQTRATTILFGTGEDCDVRATDIALDPHGRLRFTLHASQSSAAVSPDAHGEHHVTNALAAAALALAVGLPFNTVVKGLEGARIVSGARMEITDRPDGVSIINDAFNASPESVRAALRTMAQLAAGTRPTIAVLGEMKELGDSAQDIHREIGALVAELRIDRLITVGGPNAELLADTAHQAGVNVAHVQQGKQLLPLLGGHLPDKAMVLVKGAHSLALDKVADALVAKATVPVVG